MNILRLIGGVVELNKKTTTNLAEEWWWFLKRVFVVAVVTMELALLDGGNGIWDDLAPAILRRRGWYL